MSVVVKRSGFQAGAFADSAGAATGVASIAPATVVRILAEFIQNEQLLLRLGKLALDFGDVLGLDQLPGRGAFGGDGLLDLASLHRIVVVQLAELLSDVVIHRSKAGLSLAAAIRNLHLKIPLPELVLIRRLSDRAAQVGESAEHVVLDLPHQIGLTDLSLSVEVDAGFDFRDIGRIGNREVSTESANTGTSRTAIAAAAIAATVAAPAAAPETEQQNDPDPPAAVTESVAVAVVHCRHDFPGIGAAAVADRRNVVHGYCFHKIHLFVIGYRTGTPGLFPYLTFGRCNR